MRITFTKIVLTVWKILHYISQLTVSCAQHFKAWISSCEPFGAVETSRTFDVGIVAEYC